MKSILIIDDNELLLRAMSRGLHRDFIVTRSTNLADALGLFDSGHRFDAILCDMHLGDGTGREFYDSVLVRSADQASRVLFLSGNGSGDDAFGRATRHRHLVKPTSLDVLRYRLNDIAESDWVGRGSSTNTAADRVA